MGSALIIALQIKMKNDHKKKRKHHIFEPRQFLKIEKKEDKKQQTKDELLQPLLQKHKKDLN